MTDTRFISKITFSNCFQFFFHTTLCLMLLDWACPIRLTIGFLGVYEGSLLFLLVSFIGCMIQEKGRFFIRIFQIFKTCPLLIGLLAVYSVYGFITVFYGPDPMFGLVRYLVTGQMIAFSAFLLYYLFPEGAMKEDRSRLAAMGWNVGITAGGIALIALIGYFTDWYTVYYQRIATIRDYNQYSTILLMGLVAFTCVTVRSVSALWRRYVYLISYWVVVGTAVYQAGSRRSDVLLCALAAVLLVYVLFCEYYRYHKTHDKRQMAAAACLLAVCVLVTTGAAQLTHKAVGRIAPQRLDRDIQLLQTLPEGEIDAATMESLLLAGEQDELSGTLEGIMDGRGFSSRSAIWKAAFDCIRSSDTIHLLFGYGASYSWDLYDDWSNPLVAQLRERYPLYNEATQWMNPHNLFLQDALEGGLLLLLLQVLLLFAIGLSLLSLLRRSPDSAVALVLMNMVLYVTLLLSAGRGMISHKFFWLLLFVQIAENYRLCLPSRKEASA